GRFAILSKVHHALWDGVTGADVHAVLLDASPEPSDVTPAMWTARPEPTRAQLLADGMRKRMAEPVTAVRSMRKALRKPDAVVKRARDIATGAIASVSTAVQPAPACALNVEIGSR